MIISLKVYTEISWLKVDTNLGYWTDFIAIQRSESKSKEFLTSSIVWAAYTHRNDDNYRENSVKSHAYEAHTRLLVENPFYLF